LEAKINSIDQNFKIEFETKIPNLIKSTLKYYGFEEINNNKNNSSFIGNIHKVKFTDTLNFLKKNNYSINHCLITSKYLSKIDFEKENFEKKISLLSTIKKTHKSKDYKDFVKKITFLNRELKEHQLKSLYHLFNAKSAANFSVPGSGKTSVILAYFEMLKLQKKVDAIFVIGPKSCYHSWSTEFKINLNRDPNLQILGPNRKERHGVYRRKIESELFTAHFQTIKNDIEHLKKFFSYNKFLLVIDEAHNIKKIDGIWSNSIINLSLSSEYKAILTGTPLPNNLKDVYNYLDFLYGDNKIITSKEKAKIEILLENKKRKEAAIFLRVKIDPFYIRVTKPELNLSKPIFNNPKIIKMNPIEKKIYDAIVTKIRYYGKINFFDNIDTIEKICKARIIRLKQASSYIKNLSRAFHEEITDDDIQLSHDENIKNLINNYDKFEKPAKLVELLKMVHDLTNNNKKIIIWSTHLMTIDLILKELKDQKINVKKIVGKTELDDRENIKNEFNDPNSLLQVIVALPQACSESISLHKACHNAIYYDINYNAAEFLQSLDRIHRVGGSEKNSVQYDFLHYQDTVDIKVYERVFQKANRQMQIIEEDNLTFDLDDDEQNWEELYKDLNL
jgi:superfamily II DNA or RNA helicase